MKNKNIIGYGRKYKKDNIVTSLVLLYPSNHYFFNKLDNFIYEGDLTLEVIPFDFNKPENEMINSILMRL